MNYMDIFLHYKPMPYADYLDYIKLNAEPATYEQMIIKETNFAIVMAVEDEENFILDQHLKRMSMKIAGAKKQRSQRKKSDNR